jgi:hypothetical protein
MIQRRICRKEWEAILIPLQEIGNTILSFYSIDEQSQQKESNFENSSVSRKL